MKKLVIAGGTGFLGSSLVRYFGHRFDEVVILSRTARAAQGHVRYVAWDAQNTGPWAGEIGNATLVINLCGKSVNCRYTRKNRAEIFASRLDSTAAIGRAIQAAANPPALWINAASATIYTHSEHQPMTESEGVIGEGFSVEVCKAWEKVFFHTDTPATRKVNLRIGLVMGNDGGVLPSLRRLVKLGLGGTIGNGRQLVSWLHVADFCRMIDWCLLDASVNGTYNCTAPVPLSNRDLMKQMRQAYHMPLGLPSPAWLLEIGAFFLRTETELLLKSRYVIPERAMKEGFRFQYGNFGEGLRELT